MTLDDIIFLVGHIFVSIIVLAICGVLVMGFFVIINGAEVEQNHIDAQAINCTRNAQEFFRYCVKYSEYYNTENCKQLVDVHRYACGDGQ